MRLIRKLTRPETAQIFTAAKKVLHELIAHAN
jgi:hypothetical protein